jgi:predicted ATP-binding protein involved in virulence
MEDIFISHIHINEVRHLKNIDIPLSEEKRQHLILTGKNGSGKTSLWEQLKWQCENGIQGNGFQEMHKWKQHVAMYENEIMKLQNSLLGLTESQLSQAKSQIQSHQNGLNSNKNYLKNYDQLELTLKNVVNANPDFQNGDFILTYFDAKRTAIMRKPTGINKIQLKNSYRIEEKPSSEFIQYIVNLKADSSFARDDNDAAAVQEVGNWFGHFEDSLKNIFGEKDLQLRFDRKNYNFDIVINGTKSFDFTTLSDGYSAILSIVIEIMMRMENKSSRNYNIQGIVFIDEIETHLHIDLQKKILPFLTSFFPKIQFVVTTHSPFVLTSVDNAVVFDLEKQFKLENLSGYSSEAIVESYFESDKYSDILKGQVKRYEWLLNVGNPTAEQEDEIESLRIYFKQLPKFLAPELQLTINQLELAQLA